MLVTYRERHFLDRYRCIDTVRKIRIERTFESGGLLYGYTDRFNVVSIPKEFIEKIEEVTE